MGSGGPLSGAQLVSTPEQLRRYMVCPHALRPYAYTLIILRATA